ncbi:MAG: DUF898 family protein [Deltaproteobacteria bacterium]|nr:DUF898 family protein [Deltaproteobacteria bacterium]MBW2109939.1 DUF898 family protein [Deltaproteobacteria bacterium]MBW2351838.1 DUF898 family protein [Deltaproteobacteria bacterium]HDZ91500.1 DUF898 family protein [Deltaproteobacteria bacterium]
MPKGNCEFSGSGRDYLSLFIIHLFLLSTLTLGIYSPWAWVRLFKLKASHTLINGKRVAFTGTGSSFFVICLTNLLLIIVTLGIYSPWAVCRISQWKTRNTLVDGKTSTFVGAGGRLFLFYLLHLTLLPMLTFGLYYFYGIYRYYAWKEVHTRYGGEKTSFGSGFWGLMKIFLVSSLIWLAPAVAARILSIPLVDLFAPLFFIILAPWLICMFFRWQVNGLAVGDDEGVEHFPPVRTRSLPVLIFILALYLALASAAYFVWDRYRDQVPEITGLIPQIKLKEKGLKTTGTIVMPEKRPVHGPAPRSGTKKPPHKKPTQRTPSGPGKDAAGKSGTARPPLHDLAPRAVKESMESWEFERKLREIEELVAQDRENADLYYNRGSLYEQNGDYRKAEKDFTRAISINYRDKDAYYNRGLVRIRMKKYALAIEDFDRAIDLDSQSADAYCNRGNANFQLGRYDHAIRDYNEALNIEAHDPDLYYNRGLAYLSKGLKSKAFKDFRKAASLGHSLASRLLSGRE